MVPSGHHLHYAGSSTEQLSINNGNANGNGPVKHRQRCLMVNGHVFAGRIVYRVIYTRKSGIATRLECVNAIERELL